VPVSFEVLEHLHLPGGPADRQGVHDLGVGQTEMHSIGRLGAKAVGGEKLTDLLLSANEGRQTGANSLAVTGVAAQRDLEGVLARYLRCSVELGRLPTPLGKGLGFLRAKASSYKLSSFEDTMVFVVDVERSIKRLDEFEQVLVQRIALQAYTWEETAKLLRCAQSPVDERSPMALAKVSAMFLGNGMLKRKE